MNTSLVKRIKSILNSEHYSMNESWLEGCMEFFIHSEINNGNIVDEDLLKFIKTQWQLCDLREINNINGSLPKCLNQQKCTTLHGTYILQLEKMYDISTSKYKQLEEIRNISTSNIEATKDEQKESGDFKSWEPKSKRMLQLYLTDGVQDISAIEYKPIHSLNDALLPGYKVMIIGPVKCRRGIILLDESKFREIGGEVDRLLIPNAVENVLARALNCPENPDPYNDNEQKDHNKDEDDILQDDLNEEEIAQIERQYEEANNTVKDQNRIANNGNHFNNASTSKHRNNSNNQGNKQINTVEDFREDDELLEMVDESQFIESVDLTGDNTISKNTNNSKESLSKEQNSSEHNGIIIIDDDIKEELNEKETEFPADEFNFDDITIPEILEVEYTTNEYKQKGTVSGEQRNVDNRDKSYPFSELSTLRITHTKGSSSTNSNEIGNKRTSAFLSPPASISCPKIRCVSETSVNSTGNKISDCLETKIKQERIPEKICDFICDILIETVKETTVKYVRAQIATLGRLSKKNHCWQLEGTITDKTGSIDVSFSSEILEKFLGFSVEEFSQQRKLAKANPEIENQLRLSCRRAEQELRELDALLQLELKPDKKAVVINIKPLSNKQKEIIEQLLKMRQL